MPWSTAFEDPIVLPDGRQLLTLKDAADYVTKLPKEQSDLRAVANGNRGADAVQPRRQPMLARMAFLRAPTRITGPSAH